MAELALAAKGSEKVRLDLLIWDGRQWLQPAWLAGARLQRAANAAAVLDFCVVKNGLLNFLEGAPVCLLADGEAVFKGRVFAKRRTQPELIKVRAFDQLRFLQNRDCCSFRDFTPADLLKRVAAENGLQLGRLADCGLRLPARSYDNRPYLDMLTDVLREVYLAKGRRYFVYDAAGLICLQSCWDLRVNILLTENCLGGWEYATSVDEGTYNRVKVIYEDKRKGERRQFVAENAEKIADWGPLQLVSKNADAQEQTQAKARELLQQCCRRQETLLVRDVPGDLRVRGGSMVGVRLNLGERILDCWALVKRAEHKFIGGNILMDLNLECIE